ncbi:hypothetical protein ZYGR_0AS03470 [Zygosaccharomyces rouxii]|uniref:Ketopantoate reductase C-terminal domain-containing protein n=1 Tax=Zygosaccharomyces rouxii TaxID=4956 RepID=A0A1Q3AH04_ZYGRO|nr:hypothetical protein ZYGR_0AS03470 [Zygosaccharomyces rouxii]
MSSLLRVLVVGDNSNILLYASRFRLAKSVELYHVSESKSNRFEMDTLAYGRDEFQLDNHFTSVAHLEEAMRQAGESGVIFDLIILSASSLQEMSSLAMQLNPMININSKIFLESSGYIQLEQFVKMSMDLPQLNIFSIVTDYDLREVSPNRYKQYAAPGAQNCIYLGDSSPISSKKQNSVGSSSTKYPKSVGTLLSTFQKLFEKLFPQDKIDLCNGSQAEFLSTMWTTAIPKICFDPLLILLEETDPQQLNHQVLAKPLISGLVTEVITILKSMGGKLPTNLESENELLAHWQSFYAGTGEMPAMVYHFVNRTSPLNIDMLLLQPILLADDYYIKTPYLEFLYSLMSQYQKLNDGTSRWFVRKETDGIQNGGGNNNIAVLTEENEQLQSQLVEVRRQLEERDSYLKKLEADTQQSGSQVQALQNQIASLREVIVGQSQKHDALTQELKQAQQQAQQAQQVAPLQKLRDVNNSNDQAASFTSAVGDVPQETTKNNPYSDNYDSGGTPDLKDIENFALLGVSYGDTPQRDAAKQQQQQQRAVPGLSNQNTPPPTATTVNGVNSVPVSATATGGTLPNTTDVDRSLRERELEIRRKELELQEKELNFQKRAVQQQQQRQHKYAGVGVNGPSGGPPSPTLGSSRKPSYPQLQQAPGLRSNRTMHGATPGGFGPGGGYGDPMAGVNGKPHRVTAGPGGYGLQAAAPSQPQGHYPPYAIKPTSRKNRHSNMPTIGNASSVGFHDYSRPTASAGGPVVSSRVNSMSTGNLPNGPVPKSVRQSSVPAMNFPGNGSNPRLATNGRTPGFAGPNAAAGGNNNVTGGVSNEINKSFGSANSGSDPAHPTPDTSQNTVSHNLNGNSSNLQVPGANNSETNGPTGPQPPVLQVNGTEPEKPVDTNTATDTNETSEVNEEKDVASTGAGSVSGGGDESAGTGEKGKKKKFGLFGKKKNKSKK